MTMRFASVLLCILPTLVAGQETISIRAARVFDGRGGVIPNGVITVQGTRITSVAPGGRGAQGMVYELGDVTVLPGLIDAHAHPAWYFNRAGKLHTGTDGDTPIQSALAAATNAYETLLGGFTTIQSIGSLEDKDLRDAIASRGLAGPRILTSLGSVNDRTGTPEQIRAAVKQLAGQGADVIKIFASGSIRDGGAQTLTDAQLQAACGEAKANGLRSLVHAHSTESVRAATLAGCTQIEHGIFVTDDVLRLMAERGTIFSPQCGLIFRNYLSNRPRYEGIGNYNAEGFAVMERAIPQAIMTMRRALATPKLIVVMGTDAVAGAHGHNVEDIICRVREAGQRPMDAIVAATSVNAQAMNLGTRLGAIAVGLEADIIAVDGDPRGQIESLRNVVFVMKGGRVYKNEPAGRGRARRGNQTQPPSARP